MERQLWAKRLRAALDAIERPYLQKIDGLRELLTLQDPSERRNTWKTLLVETAYKEWSSLSDLYDQTERSMS
jgi:hypothetical protein